MRLKIRFNRGLFILLLFAAALIVLMVGNINRSPDVTTPTSTLPNISVWSRYPNPAIKLAEEKLPTEPTPPRPPVPSPTAQASPEPPRSTGDTSNSTISAKRNQEASPEPPRSTGDTIAAIGGYKPSYYIALANSTNYGDRYATDVNGVTVTNQPIIVLHESAAPASSVINFFQTPHDDDNVQASYHTLITLDGTVIYTVPPDKRAYGAANSVFDGPLGPETVQTNLNLPPSVNNFAYHVGLETPPSGLDNQEVTHSGYTDAQYNSLAWLIAQSTVPEERITTHKQVDRSGQRIDPRSFDFDKFLDLLHYYRQAKPIN